MPARENALARLAERERIDEQLGRYWGDLRRLNATMTSPVVDPQGFPIAGLDIPSIRSTRRRINELTNDRRALDAELATLLNTALPRGADAEVRAARPSARASAQPNGSAASGLHRPAEREPAPAPNRLVAVRSVAPQSPASDAGMEAGDRILAFDTFCPLTDAQLPRLPSCVQEGRTIRVVVIRRTMLGNERQLELALTPTSSWGGRGMLGYVIEQHIAD